MQTLSQIEANESHLYTFQCLVPLSSPFNPSVSHLVWNENISNKLAASLGKGIMQKKASSNVHNIMEDLRQKPSANHEVHHRN